jgi:hypothetical protein
LLNNPLSMIVSYTGADDLDVAMNRRLETDDRYV